MGARVFEKHFTDDNNRVGPDHKFAMNPTTWRDMVDRANELDLALGDGIKKIEANETDTSIVQRRALRYTKDLGEGDVIAKDDLIAVRPIPDNGIPPFESDSVIGKSIIRNVKCDDLVVWEDLS